MRLRPADFFRPPDLRQGIGEVPSVFSDSSHGTQQTTGVPPECSGKPVCRSPTGQQFKGGTMSLARTLFIILPMAAVALAVLLLVADRIHRRPIVGAGLVMCVIGFVPVWVMIPADPNVPPASLACFLVIVALLPGFSWRLTSGDLMVVTAWGLAGLAVAMGSPLNYLLSEVVFGALPAYLAGRLLVERIGLRRLAEVLAIVWIVVSVLALFEAVTTVNPFNYITVHNNLYEEWAPSLARGSFTRVEGAFGHPIALGVCLAAGIPLILATRWRPGYRIAAGVLVLGATIPTFSRTAIACAVIAVVLSLMQVHTNIPALWRMGFLTALVAVGSVLLPHILGVFDEAGREQEDSAGYRGDILVLVRQLKPLGLSSAYQRSGDSVAWSGYSSIDNHLLLTALRFGWIPVVLVMLGMLVYLARALGQRSNPAQIALLSLIPAYGTVAFITQIGAVVWLIAGMAASAQLSVLLESRNNTAGGGVGVVAGRDNPWNRLRSRDRSHGALAGRPARSATHCAGGTGAGNH